MFKQVVDSFKKNPTMFYAMSIAATWANAGSLLNGVSTAQNNGIVPFILWAIGNTLACIVFGIFAPMIPKLRDVFRSRFMKIVMGIMCPFQCWISMNGIQTVFADTALGAKGGVMIAMAFGLFFMILLYAFGMIRNVLTDHYSWAAVYALVFGLTVVALFQSGDNLVPLQMGLESVSVGVKNCLLLIPGAFMYPYFFELLDYNDKNEDGTANINIRKTFTMGGLVFGFYLVFIFLMSLAHFNPALNFIKAILVTLIAISSLSSFQYGMYITFGKKIGLAMNAATIALWQLLIPLGVMGAWTLMASLRVYIVAAAILFALGWAYVAKRKGNNNVLETEA